MSVPTGSWVPRGNDLARLSGQLNAAIANLSQAANILAAISNIMSQMVAGSDYTTIETYFGLQAGQGQTLHDVLGTASTDLQAGNVQGLLQRFG